ncbi:hypothetical protein CYMTET_30881 [Cymbomonas tetramitiformis]|uniref:UFSP1/2/DUB catalytic domain-containing protein n=1 Tax=Cymbomonas tetramitiformis TaxID=36881 RepID=A0AAE0FIB5_9CHLO|nr:hypothetical protein CYMTET_30881 [Cymbomonas tetramitiformis]
MELSFVLDELMGVECRVITVSDGADVPGKARELARHFENVGTPIMIGEPPAPRARCPLAESPSQRQALDHGANC